MRKKKKRGMDYGTMQAAIAPPVNTANMSVPSTRTALMGMKKGGKTSTMAYKKGGKTSTRAYKKGGKTSKGACCRGMGAATHGGKYGRNG